MRSYFKILIFLLFFILLFSCSATINQTNKKFKWPRHAFVKYQTWIYKQICQPKDPDNLKSNCYKKQEGYNGSGSVIATGFDGSYVLTAAHMCNREEDLRALRENEEKYELSEGNTFFIRYFVNDLENFTYNAKIVNYNIDLDSCIVFVWGLFKEPLIISKNSPEIGSKVYNMAAPAGFFGKNLIPLFEGYYIGEGKWEKYGSVYTIPVAGGSSGSPILNEEGELIGMIYARHYEFHHLTLSPEFQRLRRFIFSSIRKHTKAKSKSHNLDSKRSVIIKFRK